MGQQFITFWESLRTFLNQLAGYLPQLIGAFLILVIGWIVAKIIRSVVIRALKAIRFDVLTEKSGIEKFLVDGGLKIKASEVLGRIVYWLLLLVIMLAVFNSLGLEVASELLNEVILYIPNVIVSIIIVIVGSFLAKFVQGLLSVYLRNVGMVGAESISRIAQYIIIIFAISMAFEQLGIARELVTSAFQIAFGALCLALVLAFGLGARDWAAGIIEKNLKPPK